MRTVRYLTHSFDLELGYPQIDSLPWFNLDHFSNIVDNVKTITMEGKKGVGLLIDNMGSKILSVRHVLAGREMEIDGVLATCSQYTKLGESEDPVVSVKVSASGGVQGLSVMSANEASQAKALLIVHPSGNVACVSDFTYKDVNIMASVDLTHGDSGSPVIAVLRNGTLRYAGAVSRGSYETGSGNYISSVIGRIREGSPGLNSNYCNVPGGDKTLRSIYDQIGVLLEANAKRPIEKGGNPKHRRRRHNPALDALLAAANFPRDVETSVRDAFNEGKIIKFNAIRQRDGNDAEKYGIGYSIYKAMDATSRDDEQKISYTSNSLSDVTASVVEPVTFVAGSKLP